MTLLIRKLCYSQCTCLGCFLGITDNYGHYITTFNNNFQIFRRIIIKFCYDNIIDTFHDLFDDIIWERRLV